MKMLEFKEKLLLMGDNIMISYDEDDWGRQYIVVENGKKLLFKGTKYDIMVLGGLKKLLKLIEGKI
jgi:putative sterol carrier protein